MIKFPASSLAACLLAVTCLLLPVASASYAAAAALEVEQSSNVESRVTSQARTWVDELSSKPRYASWSNSALSISPLGPGTHSWLVHVTKNKEIVGYLVIHATEEGGFQLGEYGTGAYPPFNEQALQLSLLQLALASYKAERVYVDPLQAAWRIRSKQSIYYTDAMTGEGLPVAADADWMKEREDRDTKKHGLLAAHASNSNLETSYGLIPSFDPYARMPWLTKQPLKLDPGSSAAASLMKALVNREQLRFTTVAFEGKQRQVWSVVGFDLWDGGQLYLALDTDEDGADRRYLPATLLMERGQFYR
ncbi:hypothetical protein [Paenibacillus sp. PL2-23]|uniref:hypothetical protein n=1 Tax=Paenibacillus sp. PL2-23 TaxID=2100729 RepID=UPI0030F6CF72